MVLHSTRGAVLCVVMNNTGEQCFSGGVDGTIQSWNTPNPNIDPYDSYGNSISPLIIYTSKTKLLGHRV